MQLPLPGGLSVTVPQLLLASGIVVYAFAVPGDFKYKLDALGFAVCHQIHTHSITLAGHQLPLCARCTGIYLGAIIGLALLTRLRSRSIKLPARSLFPFLGLFFAAMVLDGTNSIMQTLGSGFWETTNLTRLVTGGLSGLAVAFVFYPIFNMSAWHRNSARLQSVLARPIELLPYLVPTALLLTLVFSRADWLLYPISILSIGGMLALLTMSCTVFVLIATRREGKARSAADLVTPILIGIAITLIMLTLLSLGRASLAPYMADNPLGVPLVPGLP